MSKHYKILFLSMSCNDPYFEMSRKVVHDTWAKNLINGDYPDYGFYSYTSSATDEEYVKDNCIYVSIPDSIEFTYSKTINALRILKEQGISWDYVLRTNTSTFVNVENTIELLKQLKLEADGVISFSICHLDNVISQGDHIKLPSGWYMFLPSRLTDYLIENKDRLNEYADVSCNLLAYNINPYDDALIGLFLGVYNNEHSKPIYFYELNKELLVRHYKSFINNPYLQDPRERHGIFGYNQHTNPNDVLSWPAMQIRLAGVENKYRYIELEHMYELDQVYQDWYNQMRGT